MAAGARTEPDGVTRPRAGWHLAALLAFAVLIRLPFLDQAFQLDDPTYLTGAEYVQKDPAHPWRASFVFIGERFDMSGHPHPPLNVWALGVITAVLGEVREIPFHAAYLVWTLLATAAAYSLARRFTQRPAIATLLFLVTPAFVVHGNALEADIPFTALWLAATAAFVRAVDTSRRAWFAAAGIALALASLTAYQAVLLVPVLAVYAYSPAAGRKRVSASNFAAIAVLTVPLIVIGGYQLYQRLSTGALPASVLMGHFSTYGLQSLANKLKNALALTGHLAWVIFPALSAAAFGVLRKPVLAGIALVTAAAAFADPHPLFWVSFAIGLLVLGACATRPGEPFLRAWVLLFFAGALVVFFAGAARYLLPMVLPVSILASNALRNRPRWLVAGFAVQLVFSIALARSHYEQSNAVRDFVRSVPRDGRIWTNGEWGLRYYGMQAGAQPVLVNQTAGGGDSIVSSRLGYPVPVNISGGVLRTVYEKEVVPSVPLRIVALNCHSAFSTISFGVRPFDITNAPADVLRLERVEPRGVTLERLAMNDASAASHIVSGIYSLEANQWRWASGRAVVRLKRPERQARLDARVYIPDNAPGRRVELRVDGRVVAARTLPGAGMHTVESGLLAAGSGIATVEITIDRAFTPPGDLRELGLIIHEIGFK